MSEAIAQGDWVRALWSEMVLGLSLREWREHNETIGPSEDKKSAIDLANIREDRCSCDRLMERRKWADALTKLHGDGGLLRAVCRQTFTVLVVEAPEIMAARRQEKREREKVQRVKSPLKLREPVDETSIAVTPTPTVN